ncbi:hypothetical protein OCF67_13875 [Bacillus wiedmannii]|uniref:hypothetical protein n=1 Tax=Bacillus cereus group TaxID=86661 RepID=UPI000B4AE81B|nr:MULTISPECIES: hypothetical protein [Bacillus cereus group]MCU5705276.1 hypothetical protein [Bacillus wiedmannii]
MAGLVSTKYTLYFSKLLGLTAFPTGDSEAIIFYFMGSIAPNVDYDKLPEYLKYDFLGGNN